jgi:DNA-binding NtrC family response regulator
VSVLLVDDTPDIRRSLAEFLARHGLAVREALVCEIFDETINARRILFTGAGQIARAVRSRQWTAWDYIDLPANRGELIHALRHVRVAPSSGALTALQCRRGAGR